MQVVQPFPEEDQELSGVAEQEPERKKQTRNVVARRTAQRCPGGMVLGTDHVVEEWYPLLEVSLVLPRDSKFFAGEGSPHKPAGPAVPQE